MKVMACLREHEIAALPFCLFSVAARFVPLALPFEVGKEMLGTPFPNAAR